MTEALLYDRLEQVRKSEGFMPFDVTRSPFVTFLPRKPNLIYSWAEGSLGTIRLKRKKALLALNV